MINLIIEDNEENLKALKSRFSSIYLTMIGKTGEDELLVASVKDNRLVELEYWDLNDPNQEFEFIKDAKPSSLKELLEITNALN